MGGQFCTLFDIHETEVGLLSAFKAFRKYSLKNNLIQVEFSKQVKNKKAKYQRIKDEALLSINSEVTNNFSPNNIN